MGGDARRRLAREEGDGRGWALLVAAYPSAVVSTAAAAAVASQARCSALRLGHRCCWGSRSNIE